MATSPCVSFDSGRTVTDGTTRYFRLRGTLTSLEPTETNTDYRLPAAGQIAALFVYVPANTASVTSTVTWRLNAVDTALAVAIGADQTGEFEALGAVAVAAGDLGAIAVVVPTEAGTNDLTLSVLGVNYTPTTLLVTYSLLAGHGDTLSTASVTRYLQIGEGVASSNEANTQLSALPAGTWQELAVRVTANARTTTTTFTSRVNGATGNFTVAFTSAETGSKVDLSGSDVTDGASELGLGVTTDTGAGAITWTTCNVTLLARAVDNVAIVTTPQDFVLVGSGGVQNLAQAFNTTNYVQLGALASPTTTETTAQLLARVTYQAKYLSARVSANSITGSESTIRLRVNGSAATSVLTYAAAETGVKTDLDHTDRITAGSDRTCIEIVTPNTSGTLNLRGIWLTGTVLRKFVLH